MVLTNNTARCYDVNAKLLKLAFFGALTSVGALFCFHRKYFSKKEKI